jgi:three-Cys-motif partner protein
MASTVRKEFELVAQRRYGEISPPWDDGLLVRDDHEYGLEKVELWWRMAGTASLAMRKQRYIPWRVCVDLYSGCGVNNIQELPALWWGSALLSLQIAYPFDMYVFCERDHAHATVLAERVAGDSFGYEPLLLDLGSESFGADMQRINGDTSELRVVVITGDANDAAKHIRAILPAWPGRRYCLTLIDQPGASFHWDALTMLTAGERMDLMFLFPEDMDLERNAIREGKMIAGKSRYDSFFAAPETWREIALDPTPRHKGPRFRDLYKSDMKRLLDYEYFGARDIRVSNKVADIYTLLFCSKHKKGKELWDEVNKPEHDQPELFLA